MKIKTIFSIINLSVSVSDLIFCYLHNSWTCNILTVCKKMSVGHICNIVLGGVENIRLGWVFICSFSIKQTISTSCLVFLKFSCIILFHFLCYIFLVWWLYQGCAISRWHNFVGLTLCTEFVYITVLEIEFWVVL